jgi:hypothetical protein
MPWCMSLGNKHGRGRCPLSRVADPHGQPETRGLITHCLLNVCWSPGGWSSKLPVALQGAGSRLKKLMWKSDEGFHGGPMPLRQSEGIEGVEWSIDRLVLLQVNLPGTHWAPAFWHNGSAALGLQLSCWCRSLLHWWGFQIHGDPQYWTTRQFDLTAKLKLNIYVRSYGCTRWKAQLLGCPDSSSGTGIVKLLVSNIRYLWVALS